MSNDKMDTKMNTVEQVKILLATHGSVPEKLKTLSTYSDLLKTPEGLTFLCEYVPTEAALEVRQAVLSFLVDTNAQVLLDTPKYQELLLSTLGTEVEAPIRQVAAAGLAALSATREELVPLLIEVLSVDLDHNIQTICCEVLLKRPHMTDAQFEALIAFIQVAPFELHPHLLPFIDKAPTALLKEKAILSLLKPTTPEATRQQAVHMFFALPVISQEAMSYITAYVAQEPHTKIVTGLVEKIFSMTQLSAEHGKALLESVVARGNEALPLLTLFSFKLHSHPEILKNFTIAMEQSQDAKVKLFILPIVKNTGVFEFWQAALKDKNTIVRGWALENSKNIIEKQPHKFLELLLQVYSAETSYFLKTRIIQLILNHQHLMSAIPTEKWLALFEEKDSVLLQKIAHLSLNIPFDRANPAHAILPKVWIRLLGNAFLTPQLQEQLLEKIELIEHKGDEELDKALQKMLSEIKSFEVLQAYYPRFEKLVKDPKFILPQYVKLLERYAGHYPVAPLGDILRTVRDLKSQVPTVAARIPHLVTLTQETWLLSEASEADQKNNLFQNILNHFYVGEFSEAVSLIKTGFTNSTLRKSEVGKLYKLALSHPEMYEVIQELVAMMIKVNVVTEDTVNCSFQFLSTFCAKNTSSYNVKEYLTKMGPQLPGFNERYNSLLTTEAYLNFVRQNEEPIKDASWRSGPKEWDNSDNWNVSYTHWSLLEDLEEKEKRAWLRARLAEPINEAIPLQWSVQLFALNKYRHFRNVTTEDLTAIGKVYTNTLDKPAWNRLNDRAAFLYSTCWNKLWSTKDFDDNSRKSIPAELVNLATEIFLKQVYNWLDVGGLEYSGRVAPMFGISLDHFKKMWKRDSAQWDTFWQGYTELIGINQLEIIPPEPNTKVRPSPLFVRMHSSSQFMDLALFLFRTPAPSAADADYNKMWRKLIYTYSKKMPDSYSRALTNLDSATQQRIAESGKAAAG